MNTNPHDNKQSLPDDPLSLGIPADLVFDDEPLEPLLYGAPSTAPTPASVIEIWERNVERSQASARALAAVLAQNPDLISRIGNLDSAEQCLRAAIESKPPLDGTKLGASFSGLARALELKNQMDEAESFYRQALELQEKALGIGHEVTFTTGMRLVNLLETTIHLLEQQPDVGGA